MNELADISLGDAWLPELDDKDGTSVIVSRGKFGEKLLQGALNNDKLVLQIIDSRKIGFMETKKASFLFKMHLANLGGYKLPYYNISLPSIASMPRYLLLYTCATMPLLSLNMILCSNPQLKRFIGPVATIERIVLKLGKKFI